MLTISLSLLMIALVTTGVVLAVKNYQQRRRIQVMMQAFQTADKRFMERLDQLERVVLNRAEDDKILQVTVVDALESLQQWFGYLITTERSSSLHLHHSLGDAMGIRHWYLLSRQLMSTIIGDELMYAHRDQPPIEAGWYEDPHAEQIWNESSEYYGEPVLSEA